MTGNRSSKINTYSYSVAILFLAGVELSAPCLFYKRMKLSCYTGHK
jgi:hypothetical protein